MNVEVDPNLCTACGLCLDSCPEIFDENDEGVAFVIHNPIPVELETCANDAVNECPANAILVH